MPEVNWWDSEPKWAPSGERPPTGNSGAVPTAATDTIEHGGRPTITVRPKNWWYTEPKWQPTQSASDTVGPVGRGETFGRGVLDSATFGTAPAIAGLSAAGATAQDPLPMVGDFPGLENPAQGARFDRVAMGLQHKRLKKNVPILQHALSQEPNSIPDTLSLGS